ncbi:hypothetical protein [Burkholderia cepacia]|uniref:hypothetical protein n=1 Tax=Burkholderia cepacia TaxID=292 RepID=UPI0012D9D5C1|nr:hypothetical protein [Burkholderia cepacia]
MKIKSLLATAIVLPCVAYATEPTIRISDGQKITIVGTVDQSGSSITLKPDEFVAYKENQSFQTIFKVSATSDAARESLEQFNRNWKAEADCTVQISHLGDVVCSLSAIRQHIEQDG